MLRLMMVRLVRISAFAVLPFTFASYVSAADAPPLRVAADAVPHVEILSYVQKLAPDLNLNVIEVANSVHPNELLVHGDVDANYFQDVPYLHSQEQALGKNFAVVATVHFEPLGVYSRKHKNFAQVPEGGSVAVSNSVTNLSRGLHLLQAQGLIKLKPDSSGRDAYLATQRDIVSNPKHLKIIEIEQPQLPRSLDDVDLAVINGNYALQSGLVPAKDALGLEKVEGNPYGNVLVTTPQLANDPRIKRLAAVLESPQVARFILDHYHGSVIPVHATGSGT